MATARHSTRQAILRNFAPSDLLREAAERMMRVAVDPAMVDRIDLPIMRGTMVANRMRDGLALFAQDLVYLADGSFEIEVPRSLMCTLLVEGTSEPLLCDDRPPLQHAVGEVKLIGFGEPVMCTRHHRAGQHKRAVVLTIEPAFFEMFEADVADAGLAPLRSLIEPGGGTAIVGADDTFAALAQDAFRQSYNGLLGRLFQESLALRFIAQASAHARHGASLARLLGQRRAKIVHDARDILETSLVRPPTTLDLARAVGTNVTTLQASFKQAFGTTIFGYVRARRLEMARILIVEHGIGSAEAGHRVGFTSAPAFAAAYRRHFGRTPSSER